MNVFGMDAAFNSTDCDALAEALDLSWSMYLRTGRLTQHTIDTAQAALTLAILDLASKGERNPHMLALYAVTRMARFEPRVREDRSLRRRLPVASDRAIV
jgi:hypothetical protein